MIYVYVFIYWGLYSIIRFIFELLRNIFHTVMWFDFNYPKRKYFYVSTNYYFKTFLGALKNNMNYNN